MRSELEIVREIHDKFKESYDIACNILRGGNPSEDNILFYTRKRDWSKKMVNSLKPMFDDLKNEKIEDRIIRALGKDNDLSSIKSVILAVIDYQDKVYAAKLVDAELRVEEALREKKARVRTKIDDELKALGVDKI